jgi:hypothetical protein
MKFFQLFRKYIFSKKPNHTTPFPFAFFFSKSLSRVRFPYEKWRFADWRYRLHPGVVAGITALKTAARGGDFFLKCLETGCQIFKLTRLVLRTFKGEVDTYNPTFLQLSFDL